MFVLCVCGLSFLSTEGNIQSSAALLLGDVTTFHSFITGGERAAKIEPSAKLVLTVPTIYSPSKLVSD